MCSQSPVWRQFTIPAATHWQQRRALKHLGDASLIGSPFSTLVLNLPRLLRHAAVTRRCAAAEIFKLRAVVDQTTVPRRHLRANAGSDSGPVCPKV
jgi:hypothetical protein